MIKTMKDGEMKTFLKFLPEYITHFEKNPKSLLAKIFGVYSVRKEGLGEVHVMLMENTTQLQN